MLNINDLGIKEIIRFLQYAIGGLTHSLSGWTQKLEYLHICSLWSYIAAPLVLSECFIELACHSDGIICKTNVDILRDRGFHNNITHFYINTTDPIRCSDIFREVCTALSRSHVLRRVCTLTIDIASGIGDYSRTSVYRRSDNTYIDFTNAICAIMPHVRALTIFEPNISNTEITTILFREYAYHLQYLYSLGSINLGVPTFAHNLTFLRLHIGANNSMASFPRFSLASLIVLSLSDVPANYGWQEFMDIPYFIVFRYLETLEVSFLDLPTGDGSSEAIVGMPEVRAPELHFPNLKRLTISNCPSQCNLLGCHTYFSSLHSVSISGSVESVAHSMRMGLLQQDYLKIYVDDSRPVDINMFDRTSNYLFGSLTTIIRASLVVDVDIGMHDIHNLFWPNLTSLIIYKSIDAGAFLALVLKLPNLESAMACRLNLNNFHIYMETVRHRYLYTRLVPVGTTEHSQIYSAHVSFETLIRNKPTRGSNNYRLSLQRLQDLSATRENRHLKSMSLYFDNMSASHFVEYSFALFAAALFPSLKILEIDLSISYLHALSSELGNDIPHLADMDIRNVDADKALDEKIGELEFFM